MLLASLMLMTSLVFLLVARKSEFQFVGHSFGMYYESVMLNCVGIIDKVVDFKSISWILFQIHSSWECRCGSCCSSLGICNGHGVSETERE